MGKGAVCVWVCIMMMMMVMECVEGTDHIVGANRGWQVPADAGPDAHLNYTTWASKEVFLLDDEITFNYQKGVHTVFEVNYSTFVNCTFSMWYGNDWLYNWTNRGGKTKLILNESRPYYFACGMGDHCRQGMKVAINVTTNSTSNSSSKLSSSQHKDSHAPSIVPLFSTLLWVQSFLFLLVAPLPIYLALLLLHLLVLLLDLWMWLIILIHLLRILLF